MRLIPGDAEEAQYLWPIEPLKWWRGENSIKRVGNPYEKFGDEVAGDIAAAYERQGESVASYVVDREHGDPYELKMEDAVTAFREYAEAAADLFNGTSLERYDGINAFMSRYGIPCDSVGAGSRTREFEHVSDIMDDARSAALAVKLFEFAKNKRGAAIKEMAIFDETKEGTSVAFQWQGAGAYSSSPFILLRKPPAKLMPQDWRDLAFQAAEEITALSASSLKIVGQKVGSRTQLVLSPGGLKTMLWLAFRLEINNAMDLPQMTKTCLSNERFHGCGRLFIPSNPRQKFCPECQARAQTEAKARWRAKKKGNALK